MADVQGDQGGSDAALLRRSVLIQNRKGLHARAAACLVKMAEQYAADIRVAFEGQDVSAKSIMGLMMLGATQGAEVTLTAEGPGAKKAIDALEELIHNKFHEEF